ncbi:MAG: hypothetical protein OJF59_003052 [Cytophagales bacterium]|jgi:FKBP-type peptidyl-prolyl cis-trans isomerase|nr:hypothetical protein [Bacteroidota bacterium]MBS1981277.1 hypothetical protein [Bacteroidota bacterium]WHZ09296.1 MAG: hypothetical protein OJF59_003052 [Cytophagales bacterium]
MKNLVGIVVVAFVFSSCLNNNFISTQAQFKSDTTAIRSYLTSKNILATKLPSGVWYVIDSIGLGILPVLTDSVKITYNAQLIPSENLTDPGSTNTYLLSSIIAGLQQTLLYFPSGSSGRIFVPSGLAFGTTMFNKIPANSNLIYNVKVNSVLTNLTGSRYLMDQATISSYITDSLSLRGFLLRKDSISGIQYVIKTWGTGPRPGLQDSVRVTDTTKIIMPYTLLANVNVPVKWALKNQINGLRNVLPIIRQGSSVVILVPSGYAYGSIGTETIPPNSILLYNLNLIEVIHH